MTRQKQVIRLPSHCATVAAADLHACLLTAWDQGDVAVDAGDVENVGQAVLQLLVAARRGARTDGRAMVITNPSAAFVERVRGCRLDEAIGLTGEREMIS